MPARFRIEDPTLAGALRRIEQLVRRAGGRTWLVGGSVRDLVLGQQPRDLDLEVTGVPPGQVHALLTEHFSVQFVGKAFAVFKLQGLPVDLSIPSRMLSDDTSLPGLLRQADPDMPIDEALARRDFTMNAMAWDPDTMELRDPFNGRGDLDARILRHASSRFAEDPLRVLRGMQLAARFELTVAPETVALCRTLSQESQPSERLWEEWKKLLLQGRKPSLGLQFLRHCGWLRFYPELAALEGCPQDPNWHPEGDVWIHTLHCLDWFAAERTGDEPDDLVVGLAVLCHDFGKPATTKEEYGHVTSRGHESEGAGPTKRFLERLTKQHDLINEVVPLVLCHLRPRALHDANASDSAVRRLARQVQRIDRLVRVARADHAGRPPKQFDGFPAGEWLLARARQLEVDRQTPSPIIMGRHLLELGIQPGPDMGRLVDDCYEAQLDGVFATLEEGLAYAKSKRSALC
ncbi:MAG: HD domain-containing protein [Nitrospira sp.]|nr:HD domain-containing protein [Nitrospira sp.]MDH4250707.1 HD domain-containing protein [Nitrospira sp.]MDH4344077.1 HD domain-containing protein [Nitrospira sp.]MDH5336614.1 HD domain-containing protein [Nitrospira sp.]